MGSPLRAAIPATITFAEAAISEPLPPKQEPSDKAHHTGIIISRPPISASMDFSVGIIVATKGMLSMIEDKTAENHKISMLILLMLFCAKLDILCPSWLKVPVCSSA